MVELQNVNCYSIPDNPSLAVLTCPFCGQVHQHGIDPPMIDQGIRRSGCAFSTHGWRSGRDYRLILLPGEPPERVPDHQAALIGQFLREYMIPSFGNSLPLPWLLLTFRAWLKGEVIPEPKLFRILSGWGFGMVNGSILNLEFQPAIYNRYDNQFLRRASA